MASGVGDERIQRFCCVVEGDFIVVGSSAFPGIGRSLWMFSVLQLDEAGA